MRKFYSKIIVSIVFLGCLLLAENSMARTHIGNLPGDGACQSGDAAGGSPWFFNNQCNIRFQNGKQVIICQKPSRAEPRRQWDSDYSFSPFRCRSGGGQIRCTNLMDNLFSKCRIRVRPKGHPWFNNNGRAPIGQDTIGNPIRNR